LIRSLVFVAAVAEFVEIIGEVVVAGRTVAVVAASEAGGLVVVAGIRPSAWSFRTACVMGGCSSGGDEEVWCDLCARVWRKSGRGEPGFNCALVRGEVASSSASTYRDEGGDDQPHA
jgi:hypothetical protein